MRESAAQRLPESSYGLLYKLSSADSLSAELMDVLTEYMGRRPARTTPVSQALTPDTWGPSGPREVRKLQPLTRWQDERL
jgi:hypothetical protein